MSIESKMEMMTMPQGVYFWVAPQCRSHVVTCALGSSGAYPGSSKLLLLWVFNIIKAEVQSPRTTTTRALPIAFCNAPDISTRPLPTPY